MNKSLRCILVLSVSILIAGCVGGPPKPNYVFVHDSCDWVRPLYLTDHDIDVMDRQTKKDILAHNKAWQANCQKENRASQ
ncbi:hypothetical protein N8T01_03430 [Enterobacter hormaechei subsp. steigerwaltii]|uniref:hypothetical protein n=1 Tax=Enterobacter hormaechei TaxID=158836 RepID=UPI001E442F56|nr:hypothetical protein [Enterobacter hormaechei]MCC9326961.1 hypothetical protein [Enterobacter hormaechei subsp. steigerwaltii]MCC9352649.1 hypothetical protein [Enterobacter hormaechei subsp. steigerwaltii]MCC9385435.1 hypothetical protein [Enterobacter hormaechei subsp. steigerwaltii]MCC9403331.1 hypothetical protein [Enterobacter hormaechei subsp. steigerwaltii]MCD0223522.1 hypothetical protein [Enterobacter hormaechei subsp. steigerwaltii]